MVRRRCSRNLFRTWTGTTDEIAVLEAGIKELDKAVAEASRQRKWENGDCIALMASDSAAKGLREFAKNYFNNFYNPKSHKVPPTKQSSD